MRPAYVPARKTFRDPVRPAQLPRKKLGPRPKTVGINVPDVEKKIAQTPRPKTVTDQKKKTDCNKNRPQNNKSKGGGSRRFAGRYC